MNQKKCVICNKKFKPHSSSQKTCSKKCSKENIRLHNKKYNKKYFADPKNYEKHKKYMREYMARPDVIQKEKIRKSTPEYLEQARVRWHRWNNAQK